ncbi:hypothetical protein FBUS_10039 [Fasciolopsis buskii]|uniref:Uncharacterized protein n=1 Tax=Fasciolopsis buskii TaxID=27845 RepID=A0A8E0VR65_9TREM|nr:hypothetical protein FBUS_10039 [Fasciolopsis buski]
MTKSQPVDLKPRIPSSTKQFDLNTYVMASWKNNYEYLAEVIAHRHRQGGRSEYKLRYVWDRVVEWTPAVRLRKATQFEIDYVLKFCREHGGGTTKISSTQRSPSSQSANVASPCARKGTDPVKELSSSTTRSQSKMKEPPNRQTQANCQIDREPSTPTTAVTNGPVGETKVNSPPLFDKIEHDCMVYDRSVAQFHEACRKRRELKRQAIELEENNKEVESRLTGKSGSFNSGKRFTSFSTPAHTLSKQNDCCAASDDTVEKPSKAPRLDESKDVALVSYKPPTTITKCESPLPPVSFSDDFAATRFFGTTISLVPGCVRSF